MNAQALALLSMTRPVLAVAACGALPVARRLRIAYLYFRLRSAQRGIEHRKEGIAGMRNAIRDDEQRNKQDGEFVDALGREIDRLERTR